MDYILKRSKRKTIAIIIDDDGNIVVRSPLRTSLREIDAFVEKHRDWIDRNQSRILERVRNRPEISLETGGKMPFLGREYRVRRGSMGNIRIQQDEMLIPEDYGTDEVRQWLRQQILCILRERTAAMSRRMGLEITGLKLSDAKTRWGYCTSKNVLGFSWRLVFAGEELIEYVIIHELAHIRHKDHSRAFWSCVERYCPDYRGRRASLKDLGWVMNAF